MRQRILAVLLLAALAGCSRAPQLFSEQNARAHVGMLAGTIGPRPAGTPSSASARSYIIDQLKQYGFEVRVQETDARRRELGRTARVSNVIATLPGTRREAVGLLSHYDSAPLAPGAGDDALGVAVSLETARVLAARNERRWTLFVLVTDAEEDGLMGAAALVTDREIVERLHAYINVEAVGSSGTALLFETGPGNPWLIRPWARRAPHPRGGSYGIEIYRRLPNDTDFSIMRTLNVPGLNFAAVGDSYAYHTPRDTAERLPPYTIRTTGENVVTTMLALEDLDITRRTPGENVYFDVGGTIGITYGPRMAALMSVLALLLAGLAWIRLTRHAVAMTGAGRWLVTAIWSLAGALAVAAALVGLTWLLRAAREVYHPWYARPDRLFALLIASGVTIAWSIARIGQWLPPRAHGPRHPAVAWSIALPFWIAMAAAASWYAPAAAYLWVVPLFGAGLALNLGPPGSAAFVRIASLVVFAVSATLWLRDTHELLHFIVAVMGRLPIITPSYTYAALICLAGLMLVPPAVAALAARTAVVQPSLVTALLLIATVAAAIAAYIAPAYTTEAPLRRHVRVLQEAGAPSATWEVASVEPGLDLAPDAPGTWAPVTAAAQASVPWGRLALPFAFRTEGPSPGPPPASIASLTTGAIAEGAEIAISVIPREPGASISFILPAGIEPARSNIPGVLRLGRWMATFVAPPPEGVAFRASFGGVTPDQLKDVRVTATTEWLRDARGGRGVPPWLPQDRTVWSVAATWVLPPPPAIAPVPPLR
jgi:hypothetical protein